MVIDYEGHSYELDFEDVTVRQAIVIHRETGYTMAGFHKILSESITDNQDSYLDAVSIIYWLMTGGSQIFSRIDCKVAKVTRAVAEACREARENRLRIQRRIRDGKTDDEYWAERAAIADSLPFAEQIEIKKHFQSFGESAKWFGEWYDKEVNVLRSQWLWDFGDILGMSAHDVDALRIGDFFCYCNCLQEHRKNEERKARDAEQRQRDQDAQR